MIRQRVEDQSLKGPRGVALILLVALAVILGSNLFSLLEPVIGHVSSVLFIAYGCGIAWLLLNRVMGFSYACDGSCLRVSRTYGKRERFMLDVWLNGVTACGSLDELRQRFPGARVLRAVKSRCPIEPLAVAFTEDGRTALLLLQPDEALRKLILQTVRGK